MARCLLAIAALAACGDDPPAAEGTSSTEAAADALVVEARQITDEELASLSDDDGHAPLTCADFGGAEWDYGAIGEGEGGRQPTDALTDAIADLNAREDPPVLPDRGWVELVVDDDARVFVLEGDDGSFVAAVEVSGDADLGVWRHQEAYVCPTIG